MWIRHKNRPERYDQKNKIQRFSELIIYWKSSILLKLIFQTKNLTKYKMCHYSHKSKNLKAYSFKCVWTFSKNFRQLQRSKWSCNLILLPNIHKSHSWFFEQCLHFHIGGSWFLKIKMSTFLLKHFQHFQLVSVMISWSERK